MKCLKEPLLRLADREDQNRGDWRRLFFPVVKTMQGRDRRWNCARQDMANTTLVIHDGGRCRYAFHEGVMVKILFLAANPAGTERLALDEEIRAIDAKIRRSEYGDRMDLISHWAVRSTTCRNSSCVKSRPSFTSVVMAQLRGRANESEIVGWSAAIWSPQLAIAAGRSCWSGLMARPSLSPPRRYATCSAS